MFTYLFFFFFFLKARARRLRQATDAMFNGDKINSTEKRSVLHVALRNLSNTPIMSDGYNVMEDVNEALCRMKNFCSEVCLLYILCYC